MKTLKFLTLLLAQLIISGCSPCEYMIDYQTNTLNFEAIEAVLGDKYSFSAGKISSESKSLRPVTDEMINFDQKQFQICQHLNSLKDKKKAEEIRIEWIQKIMDSAVKNNDEPVSGQTILSINPKINSATTNEASEGMKRGKELFLEEGLWKIEAIDGGWSIWPSNSATPPGKKPYTWNVYIKTPSESPKYYGVPGGWWQYSTPEEALNYMTSNITPMVIRMSQKGYAHFWIFANTNKPSETRGFIKLKISPYQAP